MARRIERQAQNERFDPHVYQQIPRRELPRRDLAADRAEILARPARPPRPQKEKIGMDELARLVVNMHQDIKKIRNVNSLQGAQRWVNAHGGEAFYTAADDDINGDNIPDVVIKDALGRPVIVDGYTTDKSAWPWRNEYESNVAPEDYQDASGRTRQKRLVNMRDYAKGTYGGQLNEEGTKFLDNTFNPEAVTRADRYKTAGYTVKKPRGQNLYTQFTKAYITPGIQCLINSVKADAPGFSVPVNVRAKIASGIYSNFILYPILRDVYGEDVVVGATADQLKQLGQRPEVKGLVRERTLEYLHDIPNHPEIPETIWRRMPQFETDDGIAATLAAFIPEHLEAMRQDWAFYVRHIVLGEPIPQAPRGEE
jgi:hypothetical protein